MLEVWFLSGAEIENIFGNVLLISASLASVGIVIIVAGLFSPQLQYGPIQSLKSFSAVGAIQGLCLPFRGFSRSGATISMGTLMGMPRQYAEEFSFVLAAVLTPPIIFREASRLLRNRSTESFPLSHFAIEGLFGFLCSFVAGLVAIHWLSKWLENGKWHFFGFYCLGFSALIMALHLSGHL